MTIKWNKPKRPIEPKLNTPMLVEKEGRFIYELKPGHYVLKVR